MSPSRRQTLAAMGGLFAGGGVLGAAIQSGYEIPIAAAQVSGARTVTLSDLPKRITFVIEPGDFRTYELSLESPAEITIFAFVRWGAELDLLTFRNAREYRAYVNGNRAKYVEALTQFGQLEFEEMSSQLSDGEHYVTVDNTSWEGEFPNVVSERQAKKTGLSKASTGDNSDETVNHTGDPQLPNEDGGVTVMGSGEHRAKVYLEITGSAGQSTTPTPTPEG